MGTCDRKFLALTLTTNGLCWTTDTNVSLLETLLSILISIMRYLVLVPPLVLTPPAALSSLFFVDFFLNHLTLLSSRMLYPSDTRQALNSFGSRRRLRFLSKWKKDLRNSSICSLLIPFESLVRIWVEVSKNTFLFFQKQVRSFNINIQFCNRRFITIFFSLKFYYELQDTLFSTTANKYKICYGIFKIQDVF